MGRENTWKRKKKNHDVAKNASVLGNAVLREAENHHFDCGGEWHPFSQFFLPSREITLYLRRGEGGVMRGIQHHPFQSLITELSARTDLVRHLCILSWTTCSTRFMCTLHRFS